MSSVHWREEIRKRTNPFERVESTECSTAPSTRNMEPTTSRQSGDSWWNQGSPYDDSGFDDNKEEKDDSSWWKRFKNLLRALFFDCSLFCRAVSSKPYIWLTVLIVFATFTSFGLYTFHRFCVHRHHKLMSEAMWYAVDIGKCTLL